MSQNFPWFPPSSRFLPYEFLSKIPLCAYSKNLLNVCKFYIKFLIKFAAVLVFRYVYQIHNITYYFKYMHVGNGLGGANHTFTIAKKEVDKKKSQPR